MIQGWVPDPLWAAVTAAAALAAAVLLNILLKLYGKKILRREDLPEPQQESVQSAAVQRRQEAERHDVKEQEFRLLRLADELSDWFEVYFGYKRIRYRMEFPAIGVSHVAGDRDGLCRVLKLLLESAAEYSGTIEVRLLFREMNRDAQRLDLMVRVRQIGGSMDTDAVMEQAERLVRDMGGQVTVSRVPSDGFDFSVFVTLKILGGSRLDERETSA